MSRARLTGAFTETDLPDEAVEDGDRDPRFNTALARGFRILRAFDPGDTFLGNAELARRAKIPKATVSRLTYTLHQLGYLNYSPQLEKYEVGPGILSLGHSVLAKTPIRTRALPLMQKLANKAGAVVTLGLRDRLSVINIEYAKAANAITRDFSIGYRLPLARSASGLACLAAMRPQERAAVVQSLKQAERSNWLKSERRIEAAIDSVRRYGFCVSLGDLDPVFNAVAAPHLDQDGNRIYVFTCFGPSFRFSERALRTQWGPKLVGLLGRWNTRSGE